MQPVDVRNYESINFDPHDVPSKVFKQLAHEVKSQNNIAHSLRECNAALFADYPQWMKIQMRSLALEGAKAFPGVPGAGGYATLGALLDEALGFRLTSPDVDAMLDARFSR